MSETFEDAPGGPQAPAPHNWREQTRAAHEVVTLIRRSHPSHGSEYPCRLCDLIAVYDTARYGAEKR